MTRPEKKSKAGRPSDLTPEAIDKGLRVARVLGSKRAIAAAMDVNPSTLYRWLEKAKGQRRGQYRDFATLLSRAFAEGEALALTVIARAAQPRTVTRTKIGTNARTGQPITETTTWVESGDWHAAARRLEWYNPRRYGRRERIAHTIDSDTPVVFEVESGNVELFKERAAKIREQYGNDPEGAAVAMRREMDETIAAERAAKRHGGQGGVKGG